jgi:hypothetical protein
MPRRGSQVSPEHRSSETTDHAELSARQLPSYVRGTVVNAASGNSVRNLKVSLRDAGNLPHIVGSDYTDSRGKFRIDGIQGEDFGLRFAGRDRGFETGWLACNRSVVRT